MEWTRGNAQSPETLADVTRTMAVMACVLMFVILVRFLGTKEEPSGTP